MATYITAVNVIIGTSYPESCDADNTINYDLIIANVKVIGSIIIEHDNSLYGIGTQPVGWRGCSIHQ